MEVRGSIIQAEPEEIFRCPRAHTEHVTAQTRGNELLTHALERSFSPSRFHIVSVYSLHFFLYSLFVFLFGLACVSSSLNFSRALALPLFLEAAG